jgi:hypothetical protein
MDLNPSDFVSINEILADVLVILDDQDNSKLTPGYYRAAVKNSLDELSFNISFLKVVNDYAMPVDLMLDIPSGCYNMQSIQIYSGTPDNVQYTENVYWRRGVQTRGKETGLTASVRGWGVTDPFFRVSVDENSLYFFSVQNGIIRLSDSCSAYDYIRLVYCGVPSMNLDDLKMVPREVRSAITLRVVEKCASALKLKDNKYRAVQVDAHQELDEFGFNGAWHQAVMRLAELDTKKHKDIILYNSSLLTH